MPIGELYERMVRAANLEGRDGAIRITATYEPAAGPGTKVSPPTYPTGGDSPYIIERRVRGDGTEWVSGLLDSKQSEVNRCEEKLQAEIDDGRLRLPHLVLDVGTHGTSVRVTSLTAPHRSRDAYFRDARTPEGQRFDETQAGAALMSGDPAAYYRHTPADLVYGVWDSHRQRRIQTKFPRVYTSEIVGENAVEGKHMAGRYDLLTGAATVKGGDLDWELVDKGGRRVSEIGLGPIPPGEGPGGITATAIRRHATLAFAGLARLRVADGDAARAGRAVLAALALLGDRLAFARPGLFLRSGCDLILEAETLAWIGGGTTETLDLSVDDARELFDLAVLRAADAGLTWDVEPLSLRPLDKLQTLIDRVFLTAPKEDE